jgi:hypothetical protein
LRGLATNIICSSGDSIFVFSRKSSRLNHFFDRTTWLLLAPEARFGELAGTISGTTPLLRAQTSSRTQDVKRTRSHRLPVRDAYVPRALVILLPSSWFTTRTAD